MIAVAEHSALERGVKKLPRRKAVRALKAAALRDIGFREHEIAGALGLTVRTLYSDRKELEAAITAAVAESISDSDPAARKKKKPPGGQIDR